LWGEDNALFWIEHPLKSIQNTFQNIEPILKRNKYLVTKKRQLKSNNTTESESESESDNEIDSVRNKERDRFQHNTTKEEIATLSDERDIWNMRFSVVTLYTGSNKEYKITVRR
jgi:hypothetical protein